ncbi:MAG: zinc ribbon domain-containing protein [Dehalococcoidia bacterium]|nr:zinc ribbon domain-containing protein [Dehalococcoidia bacterium]MDP7240774.1 zinc ribbon domain-containing protein [Dehalococcoidia bacterium]MDP7470634.1 zinc ribbon domain-containing protein [Dehalococcoidia bacterium]
MPIYEFFCTKCQKEFEIMRRMTSIDDPAPCPTCGAPGEREVSVFASKVNFYIKPPAKGAYRKTDGS